MQSIDWMVGKQYDESRDNLFKKFHSRREEKKINHQRGDESVLTLLQLMSVMPFFLRFNDKISSSKLE